MSQKQWLELLPPLQEKRMALHIITSKLSAMETRTYFLICERYGALSAGKVHLKDYDGLCEGGELRWVELGELEVVQGQRGTS